MGAPRKQRQEANHRYGGPADLPMPALLDAMVAIRVAVGAVSYCERQQQIKQQDKNEEADDQESRKQ
jgi:hypothetical protein